MKFSIPFWNKKSSLQLPTWAKLAKNQSSKASVVIEVDMDGAMEEWLGLLDAKDKVDQYWLECAYQCAKLDLQSAIAATDHDPRVAGKHAQFNFSRSEKWILANFSPGLGVDRASRGGDARGHYIGIRGKMPF